MIAHEYIGVTQARTALPEIIRRLSDGEVGRTVILKNNKPVAVLVSTETYESLIEQIDGD